MQQPDVVIAGAGVIGLSLALELSHRGRQVLVLDRKQPGLASRAAAGMLAAHDPHNPPALQPLADLALDLYPGYLDAIRRRSGHAVSIQTEELIEADPNGVSGSTLLPTLADDAGTFTLRREQSLNPRDLHSALLAAAEQAGLRMQPYDADAFTAEAITVDCTGAWSAMHVRPAKGQMLRVQLPQDLLRLPSGGNAVVRTQSLYVVPRTDGSAVIGATVEDAGFDLATDDKALGELRAWASALLPGLASARELERWAGLRPRTADDLPILGELDDRRYVANGLFRNGILLAPAVARVVAQRLSGEPISIDLAPYAPSRFAVTATR